MRTTPPPTSASKSQSKAKTPSGFEDHDQQRRDRRLVHQERTASNENRRGHRQNHHDSDLGRARADEQHEQVGHHEPDGDPEDELDGPPPALPERDAQGDHRRYRGEERALVAEN